MSEKVEPNAKLTPVAVALCASINNYSLVSKLTGISQSTLRYRSNKFKRWFNSVVMNSAKDVGGALDPDTQIDEFIEIQILNLDTQKRILLALERGESLGELAPKDAANVLKILHELSLNHRNVLLGEEKKPSTKSGRNDQYDKWSKVWKELTTQAK